MAQPALRIGSARAASDAARALETPSEVQRFELLAPESAAVRAFLATPEWAAVRARIMGDGKPPLGRPESLIDLARLFRWSADGAFSEELLTRDARAAYLHCAAELDAFGRTAARVAPVSPAPAPSTPAFTAMSGLPFGEAFLAVQAGRHVARACWPAGAYAFAQEGYPQGIGVNANTARATGLAEGSPAVFGPYLMRCSGGQPPSFLPWTPGHEELFARDWRVLPRPQG